MLDDLDLNDDGTLQAQIVKSLEQKVERDINKSMTKAHELSGKNGEGCICIIDLNQNVVATEKIEVILRVRPRGCARYIDVLLGFLVTLKTDKDNK